MYPCPAALCSAGFLSVQWSLTRVRTQRDPGRGDGGELKRERAKKLLVLRAEMGWSMSLLMP